MTKNDKILKIDDQLARMEIISNRDTFRVLSFLARTKFASFSQLKTELRLNPNSLSKCLRKLFELGLIKNFKQFQEDRKSYSFYEITPNGRDALRLNIGIPRIWELLREFKEYCSLKGWKTSEEADWIHANREYHDFIWARNVSPITFRKVTQNPKCTVFNGSTFRLVNVDYIAWVFEQRLDDKLIKLWKEEPEFIKRTAIYDLSQAYLSRPTAIKFNKTNSEVFREFENFLGGLFGIELIDRSDA